MPFKIRWRIADWLLLCLLFSMAAMWYHHVNGLRTQLAAKENSYRELQENILARLSADEFARTHKAVSDFDKAKQQRD